MAPGTGNTTIPYCCYVRWLGVGQKEGLVIEGDMTMELQVIRTIHPVGQGAFYTETLHRPGLNDDKHIVYDCGVKPYSHRLVEEICNFLPENSTIDVLFISHFHTDHVNGIKLLGKKYNIKYVVLPQIKDYEWFYIIENYLTTGNADVNIVSNVQKSIGDAKIIEVAPIGGDENVKVSDESSQFDNVGDSLFNGFSPLVIDNSFFAIWHYIVVNPLKKCDLDALRTALENIDYEDRKLTIDDLQDPNILTSVRKDLQEVYSREFKGENEYSMCVLSELADRTRYYTYSGYNVKNSRCRECWHYMHYEESFHRRDVDGGLYCGDADFMHCDTLECLKKRLTGREKFVGLLQLPHHGSKENFSIDMLNWFNHVRVSFACYGSPNRYNHPSNDVMGLAETYSCAIGVNQYKSNVLTERIDVFS